MSSSKADQVVPLSLLQAATQNSSLLLSGHNVILIPASEVAKEKGKREQPWAGLKVEHITPALIPWARTQSGYPNLARGKLGNVGFLCAQEEEMN